MAEIINKLELVYGTVASFDIWMKKNYKLQQNQLEKVTLYVTQLEGALNAVQHEYPLMLSASEVQQHLRECLHKQLHDSMCYLCDDTRITILNS